MGYPDEHEHGRHGHHGYGHRGRGHHRFEGAWGLGRTPGFKDRGAPNREEWLRRLEEYQKDLEQRVADVADMIRRLKADQPQQSADTGTV